MRSSTGKILVSRVTRITFVSMMPNVRIQGPSERAEPACDRSLGMQGWASARKAGERSLERRPYHFHVVRFHEGPILVHIHALSIRKHLLKPSRCHADQ